MSTQIIDRVLTRPTLLRISVGKKLNLSLELNNSMSVPSNVIELNAMKAVSEFLSTEGCIAVATQWNRPDPNAFPDYWGIICCCRWAFEITSLTSLDSDAYRVVGGRASDHGLARLQMPIPQVLDDSGTLRYRLEVSLSRKGVSKKLDLLDGTKYCLILVNDQFHYVPSWGGVFKGLDLSSFDSIVVAHFAAPPGYTPLIPSARPVVCQVVKNGFGYELPQYDVGDLGM